MSFLDRIAVCSPPKGRDAFLPFAADGRVLGLVAPSFAQLLGAFADVFVVSANGVQVHPRLATFEEKTRAVNAVLRLLADQGEIQGWRGEMYPVADGFTDPAVFHMERAAASHFAIRSYGIHVNGFVRDGDDLKMWIGRRARDSHVEPGKLDQMVAGGQGAGLGLMENVIKESAEEADIPAALASGAKAVGAITYTMPWGEGLKRDMLFCYDLELPSDFVPHNADGEMDGFELWPIQKIIDVTRDTDDFKFNCSLVVIDFLIRHGLIAPDHPDYEDLLSGLHQPLHLT